MSEDKGLTDKAAIRRLVKADRYYLVVRILNRIDCLHDWIYQRCREVEANPDGFIDIWAREHYKSTVITFGGTIQEILCNPEIKIGLFSHTKGVASKFVEQIKNELENNEVLKWAFDDVLYASPGSQAPRWSGQSGLVVKRRSNAKEGTLEPWGLVDGSPIGAHFDLMVLDDVVVPESVTTADQIMKTTEAWALSSSLSVEGGRTWIIGTRYHYADTYQTIMDRGAAVPRVYPATHDGTKDGIPVLWSKAEWERRKIKNTDSTLACQLLCSPLAGSQRMFDITCLQVYEARPLTLMCYLLVDPARSKKKNSAHTAMVVMGIDTAGNKYLLDGVDHKMDLMERWRWFRDLRTKWVNAPGVMGLVCGYESYGAQADLDYFKERMRVEGDYFEVVELTWPREGEESKQDRVQRLVPDVKGKRFYLPYPTMEERKVNAITGEEYGGYTRLQRSMIAAGYEYRLSRRILRLDEEQRVYDVAERLKLQFDFFPFGGRVDLLDATARIYDAAPTTPEGHHQGSLEPEMV